MARKTSFTFSPAVLAGAIAEAALHDLQVNNFTFPGFPQITITITSPEVIAVTLTWLELQNSVSFDLTTLEAKEAVKKFDGKKGYDRAIFPKVQDALVRLEGVVSKRK
ncbi:hypothetical protein [Thermomonas fusca]|uniref:hypothetical protein n=1 Tax=Thermomonas fusca TaxID=215690 RepID=UPI00048F7C22|nr:hypothetical protein [Thermomonas fusca]